MSVLDTLFAGSGGRWVRSAETARREECNFEALLVGGETYINEKYGEIAEADGILPGREFDHVGYDLCDWDGISLEFKGYVGAPPTDDELEKIWALGFTVVRIDFKEPPPEGTRRSISGDWWREKGHPAGCCSCKHLPSEPHRSNRGAAPPSP